MAKLQKYHDITDFCSSEPFRNGKPQDHVKFDAKTQTLVACDGKVAIVVPVSGVCGTQDGLIPQSKLTVAADKQYDLAAPDGQLTLNKKEVTPNGNADVSKFGDVFAVLPGQEPDLVIPLSLETLEPLVDYIKQHSTGGIYLCVNHKPGDNWQARTVTSGMQFFFDVATGEKKDVEPVQVVGVLMPCSVENMQAVHSRVRAAVALANAGKSEKDKAAAARKKAAAKKAAKTAPANDAMAKTKGKRATPAPADAAEDPPVAAPPKANGKAKTKGNAKGPAKAAPKPAPALPRAAKADTNGEATPIADMLTRARASISRGKLAAAKRTLNKAREEVLAGNVDAKYSKTIDELLASILKGR